MHVTTLGGEVCELFTTENNSLWQRAVYLGSSIGRKKIVVRLNGVVLNKLVILKSASALGLVSASYR